MENSHGQALTIFHSILFFQVPKADNYFPAKSAERRGRSSAGPQTMFDIFF